MISRWIISARDGLCEFGAVQNLDGGVDILVEPEAGANAGAVRQP